MQQINLVKEARNKNLLKRPYEKYEISKIKTKSVKSNHLEKPCVNEKVVNSK